MLARRGVRTLLFEPCDSSRCRLLLVLIPSPHPHTPLQAEKASQQLRRFSLHAAGKGGLAMRARLEACKRKDELRQLSTKRRKQIEMHMGLIKQLHQQRHKVVAQLWKDHDAVQDAFEACGLSSSLAPRPGMRPQSRSAQ